MSFVWGFIAGFAVAFLMFRSKVKELIVENVRLENGLRRIAELDYDPDEAYDREREDRAMELPQWKDPDNAMDEARDMAREIERGEGL
jgi:hypothetical protein